MENGFVFDIKKYSLHDGPGIRTTVFLKGCPLSCWWCHNPESQLAEPEREERPGQGRDFITEGENGEYYIGKRINSTDVMREVEKDIIFYDESGGGVTFSGGEPLSQPEFLRELLEMSRTRHIHRAVDTSGYAEPGDLEKIIPLTDLFLFDIKLVDDNLHRQYTGVSNELIFKNLHRLMDQKRDVIIRFPVIPGITDTQDNLEALAGLLTSFPGAQKINLLPFNHYGDQKYVRLKRENHLKDTQTPSREEMEQIRTFFTVKGFETQIGG